MNFCLFPNGLSYKPTFCQNYQNALLAQVFKNPLLQFPELNRKMLNVNNSILLKILIYCTVITALVSNADFFGVPSITGTGRSGYYNFKSRTRLKIISS